MNSAQQIEGAERRAQILDALRRGYSGAEVGRRFDISRQRVHQIKREALTELAEHAEQSTAEYRLEALERLEQIREDLRRIADAQHLLVSSGKVVRQGKPCIGYDSEDNPVAVIDENEGEPLVDVAPVITALDKLIKVEDRWSKLLGLDAPVKQEISGGVTFEYRFSGAEDV